MSNLRYTLGIDLGNASAGAAVITDSYIHALHVRTFERAEGEKGKSLNEKRRIDGSIRRRLRRRAARLLRMRRFFKHIGLTPDNTAETIAAAGLHAWELRAEGLDRPLAALEWAAVLYHLVKHRGFQSTRKSEAKSDEKAGAMLGGISRNQALMRAKGWRTIGEMAARDPAFALAKRNKQHNYSHTFARADIAAEMALLFSDQRRFGNAHADEATEAELFRLLMERRPALSGEQLLSMVGKCTFEPTEYRAPRNGYRAERFVWLSKLNNLKIADSGVSRPLTLDEHARVKELPFTQAKLTYKQLRAVLTLPETARFNLLSYRVIKGKDNDPEEATLFEAKGFHALRKAYEGNGLKAIWQRDARNPDRLDALAYALTCFKDDDEARPWLADQGVEPDVTEAVLELSFDKFLHLSTRALANLLPFLEQGLRYDEAARRAGYEHSRPAGDVVRQRYLPAPDKQVIANPVVYRAINQGRKLINAIVKEYGAPTAVHIELARDLTKPFDERKRIEREQQAYRDAKNDLRKDYERMFGVMPNGLELDKWRLYREQNGQCAYTQKPIDLNRLREDGYVEVDHILPYSRSFDDSQNNKALVLTAENRNKGNRTPFEYMGGDQGSARWLAFEAWVNSTKTLRQAKRNRLLRKDFGPEASASFRERHLNDTRYICRELKRMIETHLELHPDADGKERCVVVAGQLTSLLRARWGLLKNRDESDLHHAMDAAVIAAANPSLVKRMAEYAKAKELRQVRGDFVDPETGEILDVEGLRQVEAQFPEPWPHFRQELRGRLSPDPAAALAGLPHLTPETMTPIRVSRAPTRRGTGQAHQATIRSIGKNGRLLAEGKSAVKTALTELTLKDLENIEGYGRDPQLINVIRARLEQHDGDGKKAFATPVYKPSMNGQGPIIRSVKLRTIQKSGMPVRGGFADNGDMLRVDIFMKDGRFHAVPVYVKDAARGLLPNHAVVANKPESEWTRVDDTFQFLFSLYRNDYLRILYKNQPAREGYCAGFDRGNGGVDLLLHDRNVTQQKNGMLRGNGIKTALSLEKYHVDLLGRLHRARREERRPLKPQKGN